MVPWWGPRPSKPLRGVKSVLGVFDSHTPPPFEFSNPPMAGFSFATKVHQNDAGLIGTGLLQARRRPAGPIFLSNKALKHLIRKEARERLRIRKTYSNAKRAAPKGRPVTWQICQVGIRQLTRTEWACRLRRSEHVLLVRTVPYEPCARPQVPGWGYQRGWGS